ncbi:hypothetical protein BD769DRAFT_1382449 [Suillus cothurnatus]|nr:hypothetical protein BD769DRAFT_1382449 [Suillus cothurnatus]
MKEPRTPATLRVPPRRQHPRLLLERDDVPIMRQTFSAEHRPFKLRRQAPAVARSGAESVAVLQLCKFKSIGFCQQKNKENAYRSSPATHNVTPTLVISEPVSQSESLPLVDTMHPIDKISPETPPNTPAVDSLPVTCPQVDSLPVSHPQVNSQQVNSPSPVPSPSDEQGMSAENELIIQRKTKSIRSRSDRVTWYHTYSRSTLSTPSTSPLLYSHELCRGDLRLHKSQQDGQIQTWVWDGLQWVGIEHGDPHLNLPGYRLKLVGEEPNWVTRKTVVDDIGRAKRAASTAPPLFVRGSVPSSALEDGSGRGLGSGFP